MLLSEYLDGTYLADRIGISAAYAAELRRVVWQFGNPKLSELSKPLLASFLRSLTGSPATTNNKRRELVTLWRAAHDEGMAPPPSAPKSIPEPTDPPTAWTIEEVSELLWTAEHWPGCYAGIPATLWWASLFTAVYWTGARVGAIMRSTWSDYTPSGLIVRGMTQKNRRGQLFRLPVHCREKLDAMPHFAERIWPWPHCRRCLFATARRIIERAGLECPKTGRQLFHRLRRTTLSYCAAVDIGIAQRQAGHASSATTLRHYIAPAICQPLTAADVLPTPSY